MNSTPQEGPQRTRRRPPGLLVHRQLSRDPQGGHADYFTTILHYGTKVAGLQILPPGWVPPYVALPAWLSDEWTRDPQGWIARARRRRLNIEHAAALASDNGRHQIIVRSSAVGEGLDDRGLYKSKVLPADATFETLVNEIEEIFRHFAEQNRHTAMGICLQRHMAREFAGHVSNEAHLSATRNQWKYGIEAPAFAPDRGLNSKFASAPDEDVPLALSTQKDIAPALRRVCNWVNLRIDGRSHLEWCAANGRLWVVQLDRESPTSAGLNPHVMPEARGIDDTTDASGQGLFQSFRVQDDPPWRKLRNLRDFWTSGDPPQHRLFYATGNTLKKALEKAGSHATLAAEIDSLTGGRSVLRTDCKDPGVKAFNLPRTHTVDGVTAAAWIGETLASMVARKIKPQDIAIILHRYIPARAAAWTYYSPGDDFVRVDCLWGLPDGLQFLSHDSFQVDARTGEELAAEVRYKPDFLQEQDDGSWRYVPVARQYGRDRVLSRESLRTLTLETVAVARKIKERAQIMWFCDLPAELGLGQHLPWYRSKEFAGYTAVSRPALPTRRVRNLADLEALGKDEGRFIILAAPDVELVRDDDAFLDRVIALATGRGVAVELAGSVLGHAYYRLRAAGVVVLVPQPKYPRVRGLHRHFKVVRDEIPRNIAAKGERVSFARLAASEALVALIGKLFEEGLELNAARAPDQRLEELADVLEVVRGLATTSGVAWDALTAAASAKREKRGGFEQQMVLLETARPMPGRAKAPNISGDAGEPSIQLHELGIVAVDGDTASISFSKLLSHTSIEVELLVEGRLINMAVAFDGTGLRLVGSGPQRVEETANAQLELFRGGESPSAGPR